jgi:hypothetical protein
MRRGATMVPKTLPRCSKSPPRPHLESTWDQIWNILNWFCIDFDDSKHIIRGLSSNPWWCYERIFIWFWRIWDRFPDSDYSEHSHLRLSPEGGSSSKLLKDLLPSRMTATCLCWYIHRPLIVWQIRKQWTPCRSWAPKAHTHTRTHTHIQHATII